MHFSAGFWGLFIMQHVCFPADSPLSLRNCLIKKGLFIPCEIATFSHYSSISVDLFSKVFTLEGCRTPFSISENHAMLLVSFAKPILSALQRVMSGFTMSELASKLCFWRNVSVLLEIHCLHETQQYLRKMVHEIGLELKSSAVCTQVRRIRDGVFTVDDALPRTQWNLQSIQEAIQNCQLKVETELEKTLGHGESSPVHQLGGDTAEHALQERPWTAQHGRDVMDSRRKEVNCSSLPPFLWDDFYQRLFFFFFRYRLYNFFFKASQTVH